LIFDIWELKWSAFLLGMIAGAYLSDFVKQYALVFVGCGYPSYKTNYQILWG
jgi:hypothetical protein